LEVTMRRTGFRRTKTKPPSSLKATKVQLRLRADQKAVLARAAQLRHTSLSNFMLEHAYEAAQQVPAEQVDIVMPPAEWQAFCKALDKPPRYLQAGASSMDQERPDVNCPLLLDARQALPQEGRPAEPARHQSQFGHFAG
jgi:uncharacterized protein (DUF1778 family)